MSKQPNLFDQLSEIARSLQKSADSLKKSAAVMRKANERLKESNAKLKEINERYTPTQTPPVIDITKYKDKSLN